MPGLDRLRWCAPLFVLAACGRGPQVLELDLNGRSTLLLAVINGSSVEVTAYAAAGFDLQQISAQTKDSEIVALLYDATPEALAIAVGPLSPGGSTRLPPADLSLDSVGGAPWTMPSTLPPALEDFRFSPVCAARPPPGTVRTGAIPNQPGCPPAWPERERSICYGGPRAISGLPAATGGLITQDGLRKRLYFEGADLADPSNSRLFTVDLGPSLDTVQGPITEVGVTPSGPMVGGQTQSPWIRADGLELFVASNYPDHGDPEIQVSGRAHLGDPWPLGQAAGNIGIPILNSDGVFDPILLADDRSIVYRRVGGEIYLGRRPSSAAGDLSFEPVAAVETSAGTLNHVQGMGLSCDGGFLLYVDDANQPRMRSILRLPMEPGEVLSLGPLTQLAVAASPPDLVRVTEAPDCSLLILSGASTLYVAERVPCM
ncbi:MAG: hypothetical protein U1E65_31775 [Myxococcota bacterium]